MKKETLDAIRTVPVRTESDLYVGRAGVIDVDLSRINDVVERTMEGLYYHHQDQRLPDEYEAAAFALDGLPGVNLEVAERFVELYQFVREADRHIVGDDVFNYRMRFLEETPNAGVFFCTFYKAVNFIGFFA